MVLLAFFNIHQKRKKKNFKKACEIKNNNYF